MHFLLHTRYVAIIHFVFVAPEADTVSPALLLSVQLDRRQCLVGCV